MARLSENSILQACFSRSPGALSRFAPANPVDWECLIRSACAERLLPALGYRLRKLGCEVPPDIEAFLAAVEAMNRERNDRILEEARMITGLLNQAGIEPVFLKGAAFLVEDVYPASGLRYLCDLDLLIPAARLNEAAEILRREGYDPDTDDALARFRHHYPQLQRPLEEGGGSAPVELHHSLGHAVSRRLLNGEEMYSRSRPVRWRGVAIRIPSPEDLLVHLILHSQIHHSYRERVWPPLRAMYDLVMLENRYGAKTDWKSVTARFRAYGQEQVLLLHLLQVKEILGFPLPFFVRLGLAGHLFWARRRALMRWPVLRFFDPGYLASSAFSRRFQFLQSILSSPGGWKHAAGMLFSRGFYNRITADMCLR